MNPCQIPAFHSRHKNISKHRAFVTTCFRAHALLILLIGHGEKGWLHDGRELAREKDLIRLVGSIVGMLLNERGTGGATKKAVSEKRTICGLIDSLLEYLLAVVGKSKISTLMCWWVIISWIESLAAIRVRIPHFDPIFEFWVFVFVKMSLAPRGVRCSIGGLE